ncbi:hypothetical protein E2C01_044587 [Portunus trituberculatus]|uniref:Uncharacterized protein n=1 Tax=Portunus trituberculatus TaxID=210409 RepID=A0A5B7FZK6_PORTR|nr:hypothetical protein [Portunus trituberculatus]
MKQSEGGREGKKQNVGEAAGRKKMRPPSGSTDRPAPCCLSPHLRRSQSSITLHWPAARHNTPPRADASAHSITQTLCSEVNAELTGKVDVKITSSTQVCVVSPLAGRSIASSPPLTYRAARRLDQES